MFEQLKCFIKPTLLAFLYFIISSLLKYDAYFFDYIGCNTKNMIVMKVLYLLFLLFIFNFSVYLYKKYKEGDKLYRRGIQIGGIYFLIITFVLILVWPGLWAWDDIWVLNEAIGYRYFPWQHIFSSMEIMLYLQVLPFIGGALILRTAIISTLVAFIIVKLETGFNLYIKNRFWDYTLKLLPFLMFPIIRHQLSGYRMGIYIFFEVAMICIIICAIKNKEKWNFKYFALFAFISVITIVLRDESMLYLPVIILILLFALKDTSNFKKRCFAAVIIIAGVFFINSVQNYYIQKTNNNNYKLITTLRPCVLLLNKVNPDNHPKEIENIGKVVNIPFVHDHLGIDGETLYFTKWLVYQDYTKEDYNSYLKSFFKLCMKYPRIVIKERWDIFYDSTGFNGSKKVTGNRGIKNILYQDIKRNKLSPIYEGLGKKCFLNKPINRSLHEKISTIIILDKNDLLYKIVWNFIFPTIIIFSFWLYTLFKREWAIFLIFSTIICKFFIIVLTAPASWFMYYLSFYFIGYIILFYGLLYILSKKEKESIDE